MTSIETAAAALPLNRLSPPMVGPFHHGKPFGFDAGDTNFYRYVSNSPTNATDPSGLKEKLPFISKTWDDWLQDPAYRKKSDQTPDWTPGKDEANNPTRKTPGGMGSLTEEGPALLTRRKWGAFRMTIEFRMLDKKRVPPNPPNPKNPIVPNNQHYGNSGVYIFDRYEVQIVDPSRFGVPQGQEVKTELDATQKPVSNRNQLLPGGMYGLDPPNGKFINHAKPDGQWNTLVIVFYPPITAFYDPSAVLSAANITVTLNGQLVFDGPIQDNEGNPLKGTGARLKRDNFVSEGSIYL